MVFKCFRIVYQCSPRFILAPLPMSPLAGCILSGKMVTEEGLDPGDQMQLPGPEHDVGNALKAPGPGDPLGDLDEADLENPATPTLPTFEVDVKLGSTRGSSEKLRSYPPVSRENFQWTDFCCKKNASHSQASSNMCNWKSYSFFLCDSRGRKVDPHRCRCMD